MKFVVRFYDIDDPKLEDDTPPLWEERCWVTLDNNGLTIYRKRTEVRIMITSLVMEGDWQPSNCFVVWGFESEGTALGKKKVTWRHVKVELHSASKNIMADKR